MSHEVETMAWTGQVPWHGLGSNVDADTPIEEFAIAAGLDWTIERRPLHIALPDGSFQPVPDKFAMTRSTDNKVLTLTGHLWKPVQPKDTLEFMRSYVTAGGATIETAGSLRGGKIIWCLAKLNHSFEVSPGDKVEGYLLFTSPNVVGNSSKIRTTGVRVVCANTMAMAEMGGEVNYSQNHLTEFDMVAAKAKVAAAHEELAAAERRAKIIHNLHLSAEDAVRKVLLPVFEPSWESGADADADVMDPAIMPKKIAAIMHSNDNAPGAEPDTGWGILNAVTHWADHVGGRTPSSRLYRSWMGDNAAKKLAVEKKLVELAA